MLAVVSKLVARTFRPASAGLKTRPTPVLKPIEATDSVRARVASGPAAALLVVLWLVCPATAMARPKTDVIVLNNGDRVTCEIKKLSRGLLQVSTNDMGTINIEWTKIATVTSAFWFEVETWDGSRHYGTLEAGASGQLGVVSGDDRKDLALLDVVRLSTIETSFWDRLYGNIGAGGSYTQSSGVAQASFDFLLGARRPAFEWQTSFDSTLTVQESQPDSGRFTAKAGYTRLLSNRWLVPGVLTVEQNKDLGFTLRTTAAGGIGRTVIQSNRSLLRLGAALAANREVPVDGPSVTNIDASFAFTYEFFTYDFPKTSVSTGFTGYPGLSDWGRFRFNSRLSLSRELFTSDFYVDLTFYDDFDNRPPTEDASKNDVGVTFSLGWKF